MIYAGLLKEFIRVERIETAGGKVRFRWRATASGKKRAIVALAAMIACFGLLCGAVPASSSNRQGPPAGGARKATGVTTVPETVRVLMPDKSVRVMYMDDYLKGVVPAEVSADWPYDALCAQAIASRCYAATAHKYPNADVDTTTNSQVWRDQHDPRTDLAVDSTHKVAAFYDGQVIEAFFFGHCDGHTRNSEDAGWGYVPYCRSVGCPCGNTTLWGHGVGMCQEGARVLAQNGWDYRDILKHYYTGVEVRSTEQTASNWYFAEGTSRAGFATYLCLGNPGETGAQVRVSYMMDGGGNVDRDYTVPAHSRRTVLANADVGGGKDFSCEVLSTNGVPVVAERPIYFDYKGKWTGGSDTVGSAFLRSTWYFAEGTTRSDFETYLCIGNPSDSEAQVTVEYMVEGAGSQDRSYTVGPRARKTIEVAREIGTGKDFACTVDSPNGVGLVVERPMYFNYQGRWTGGHDALGSLSARPSWYFAEGTTRSNFDTYLCLANPNDTTATVKVAYLLSGGGKIEKGYSVAPTSRTTLIARNDVGTGRDFSCRITSTNEVGIIAERPMYFKYGVAWTGGSDAMGTSYPKPSWYFAEGTTRPNFATYICLSNPSEKGAQVKVTYLKGDGSTAEQQVFVAALSRTTISANDFLGVADDASHDIGIKVESTNNVGIIAERPMYFDYGGSWTGGHDAMGY